MTQGGTATPGTAAEGVTTSETTAEGVDDVRGSSRGSDDGRSSGHGSGADSKGVRADRKEGGSHSDRKAEKEKRESLKEGKDRGSPMLGRYVCFLVRSPNPHSQTVSHQSCFKW